MYCMLNVSHRIHGRFNYLLAGVIFALTKLVLARLRTSERKKQLQQSTTIPTKNRSLLLFMPILCHREYGNQVSYRNTLIFLILSNDVTDEYPSFSSYLILLSRQGKVVSSPLVAHHIYISPHTQLHHDDSKTDHCTFPLSLSTYLETGEMVLYSVSQGQGQNHQRCHTASPLTTHPHVQLPRV